MFVLLKTVCTFQRGKETHPSQQSEGDWSRATSHESFQRGKVWTTLQSNQLRCGRPGKHFRHLQGHTAYPSWRDWQKCPSHWLHGPPVSWATALYFLHSISCHVPLVCVMLQNEAGQWWSAHQVQQVTKCQQAKSCWSYQIWKLYGPKILCQPNQTTHGKPSLDIGPVLKCWSKSFISIHVIFFFS